MTCIKALDLYRGGGGQQGQGAPYMCPDRVMGTHVLHGPTWPYMALHGPTSVLIVRTETLKNVNANSWDPNIFYWRGVASFEFIMVYISNVELGTTATGRLLQPGTTATGRLLQPGTTATGRLLQPGTTATGRLLQPGTTATGRLLQPGTTATGRLLEY